MNEATRRAALRATSAVVGLSGVAFACSSKEPAPPPAPDCTALVQGRFGTEDPYLPFEHPDASPEVTQCCTDALIGKYPDVFGKHRWACCAVGDQSQLDAHGLPGSTCIPWGPPVPPRRGRRLTARRRTANLAAAASSEA